MEDIPLTLRLLVLFLLLGVNSFFAAAEVALVSVRKTRMRELAEVGDRRAATVLHLIEHPDRMLSATQLGVTLASLGLGWAGESTVYRLLEPLGVRLLPEGVGHLVAFVLSFAAITFLHMVLGEVVPKNLAIERSERMALAIAPPLDFFTRTTGFFVSFVKGTAEKLSRLLGLKLKSGEAGYTPEELKMVVSVSQKEGEHAEHQERLLHRVIDLYDLTAREIMTPRSEMAALPIDAGFDQLVGLIARTRHSRLPVYEGPPENVVGVVHMKDLWSYVEQMRRWQALERPPPQFLLRRYVNDVEFLPETKLLYELLEEFQEKRYHLAMVVDEFGTVSGLVTLEDVLEQIVGEIHEEHEKPKMLRVSGAPIEVDGITNIRDLETEHDIELPYDAGFETLAGFLLSRFGHIPRAGEELYYDGRIYRVLEMDRNRIARVRIESASAEVRAS